MTLNWSTEKVKYDELDGEKKSIERDFAKKGLQLSE